MQDDEGGRRLDSDDDGRVDMASRKTGCPSPGDNEYCDKSQNASILLHMKLDVQYNQEHMSIHG